MIHPIITVPNPILARSCESISKYGPSEQALVNDLFETMHAAHGLGLAAPQIGVSLCVAVIEIPQEEFFSKPPFGKPIQIILLNPIIGESSGSDTADEGCLSIPDVRYKITRPFEVAINTFHPWPSVWEMGHYKFEGLLARAAQHEIDHLNGILISDRAREQGVEPSQHSA